MIKINNETEEVKHDEKEQENEISEADNIQKE